MRIFQRLLSAAAITIGMAASGTAAESVSDRLTFQVLLDDKPIGSHSFRIAEGGTGRVVESNASFDVSILFVPVFSYRHNNTEVWQDGCLNRISSETDSNGTLYAVDLQRDAGAYRLATRKGSKTYEAECLMTFAYWDQRFLQQERLLNSQTGELVEVEVEAIGASELEVSGRGVPVEGFRILAEPQQVDIKVYYSRADGRWVALESLLENGRTMRYIRVRDEMIAREENGKGTSGIGR